MTSAEEPVPALHPAFSDDSDRLPQPPQLKQRPSARRRSSDFGWFEGSMLEDDSGGDNDSVHSEINENLRQVYQYKWAHSQFDGENDDNAGSDDYSDGTGRGSATPGPAMGEGESDEEEGEDGGFGEGASPEGARQGGKTGVKQEPDAAAGAPKAAVGAGMVHARSSATSHSSTKSHLSVQGGLGATAGRPGAKSKITVVDVEGTVTSNRVFKTVEGKKQYALTVGRVRITVGCLPLCSHAEYEVVLASDDELLRNWKRHTQLKLLARLARDLGFDAAWKAWLELERSTPGRRCLDRAYLHTKRRQVTRFLSALLMDLKSPRLLTAFLKEGA